MKTNPLYNMIMSGQMGQSQAISPQAMNPVQKMQLMMQAMTNPAAFVRQAIPDIPAEIQNDPNQILQYLQQTRHISNQQIQDLINQNPYPGRRY